MVTKDGAAVVSHVGSRLLAGMADRSGLTESFSPEPRRSRAGYPSEVTHIEQVFER